jgi:valyl-tRNA synthetase
MDVYVDLSGHIDVAAEVARNDKLLQNLVKQIAGKEKNLANENFVSRAPAELIEKERQALSDLLQQKQAAEEALTKLKSML